MQDSKLVSIIKHFSNKQLRQFDDFVASPYFNKKKEVIQLYRFIQSYAPEFKHNKLSKEQAYAFVLPKKPYNEKMIGYWMSDLVKLVESFITSERLENYAIQRSYYLLETYNQWGLEKAINATMTTAQKVQKKYAYRNHQYYYNEYLIHGQGNTYFDKQRKHKHDQSLQKAIDNLDLFYLSQKLKYSCEIVNRQYIVSSDYELKLLNEILTYLESNPHEDVPPVAIYSTILKCLLEKENESHFIQLKILLHQYAHLFTTNEARDMYVYAINYCIAQINRGGSKYLAELFDIYKAVLAQEVIFDGKYLSPWSFKNIVGIGVRNQAYKWTEDFILQYKNRLDPRFKKNAYTYNLAYLYFYLGKFSKAQSLLNEVVFEDVFYSTEARALLLRIYYELDEIEPLLSLTDSFKIYLRRNKLISENNRHVYLNFVKFITRLSKLYKGDNKALLKLKKQIAATKNTANLSWLMGKIETKLTVKAKQDL